MSPKAGWLAVLGLLTGCINGEYFDQRLSPEPDSAANSDAAEELSQEEPDAAYAGPFFVDPLLGNDTFPCTEAQPCKTLTHAVPLAFGPQSIYLKRGTYSATSGESFPIRLPDKLTLEAVTAGEVVLMGQDQSSPFSFTGQTTIRNLKIKSFAVCIDANAGPLALSGLELTDCEKALSVHNDAQVQVQNTAIDEGTLGFSLTDRGQLTLTDCTLGNHQAAIGQANDQTHLTLVGVRVQNAPGSLEIAGDASALLSRCALGANGRASPAAPQIRLDAPASLTLVDTQVLDSLSYGLLSSGTVSIYGGEWRGSFIGQTGGSLHIQGAYLHNAGDACVDVQSTDLVVINTRFEFCERAIRLWPQTRFKLRESKFYQNQVALSLAGCENNSCDLGNLLSPGHNDFNSEHQRNLMVYTPATTRINAAGNTWIPLVQNIDTLGHTPPNFKLTGPYTETGNNFLIPYPGPTVYFY